MIQSIIGFILIAIVIVFTCLSVGFLFHLQYWDIRDKWSCWFCDLQDKFAERVADKVIEKLKKTK